MRSNMTGVGYYKSEPRNYNRGFGHGISKPFQQSQRHPSPQPPRSGSDPFMEAGRMAVEYLISRGLLPSNVLTGKYQNGSLRNNFEELNDIRSLQDRDSSRRSSVDQDQTDYSRERRRLGLSRSYSSNLTRENEREGSLTKEPYPTRAIEVSSDAGLKDTTSKDTDGVVQVSHSPEPVNNDDNHSVLQDDSVKGCAAKDSDSKMTSLVKNKDDEELMKPSDATVFDEARIGADDHDQEKDAVMDNLAIQLGEDKNSDNSSKSNSLLITEENNISTVGLNSLNIKNFNDVNDSEDIPSSKSLGPGVFDDSFGDAGVVNHPGYLVDEKKCMEPLSFTDKTFSNEEKSSGLPELGLLCSSIGEDRGEKRTIEEDKCMEGAKKAKQQWISVAQSDEYSQISDLNDKHSISPAKNAVNLFNVSSSQENFTSVPLPLKSGVESNINQGEKQLLSNSFKICDLNLMEASDMHDNHENHLLYPTMSGPSQDILVNIDLSMRNNIANEYNASSSVGKEIEIIDLESASLEDCKSSNTSMKNSTEASMTTIENFSNQQNTTENPDAQDGYGFMISELLGNEVPTPVQPDMNSMHNDMGLNHPEGMFSEDDPIYMSLGEIPLTGLLRAWEQPTQERNPFEL